jgi:hypothetical protein
MRFASIYAGSISDELQAEQTGNSLDVDQRRPHSIQTTRMRTAFSFAGLGLQYTHCTIREGSYWQGLWMFAALMRRSAARFNSVVVMFF